MKSELRFTTMVGVASSVVGAGAVAIAVVALGVSLVGELLPLPVPMYQATESKVKLARDLAYLGLDRDGISAVEAGTLASEYADSKVRWEQPCDEDVVPDSPIAGQLAMRCLDHTKVFEATDRGMTLEERAHIEAHLRAPELVVLEGLATARGLERPLHPTVQAALDRGEVVLPWSLPIPKFSGLRRAAYISVAYAALLFDEGEPEAAEEVLRQTVSAGLLMVDEGASLIEALIGATLVKMGAEGLEELYERTWRQPEADRIREALDRYVDRSSRSRPSSANAAGFTKAGLPLWTEVLQSETTFRGLRWEAVTMGSVSFTCGSARSVLFGPSSEQRRALAAARERLVRSETSSVVFDIRAGAVESLAEATSLGEDLPVSVYGHHMGGWQRALGVPVELTANVLGNPRVDGCFWLYLSAMF